MKKFIKNLLPESMLKAIRPVYHGLLARLGSMYFGHPSEKMIVIGVTGTNGKTTTVNLIARILREAGYKTGFTSTAVLNIEGQEHLNKMKMTMPSGWVLQKWMKQMLDSGCKCVVIEISSEGLAQNRHLGINFDIAVFTNLTPEHLESHGGFENYKAAKNKLFEALSQHPQKIQPLPVSLPSQGEEDKGAQKTIITNADDEYGKYYASFKAEKYLTYGIKNPADFVASDIQYAQSGIKFQLLDKELRLHLRGQFDVYNSLAAIAAAQALGVDLETCKQALEKIAVVPGRVEIVHEKTFTVVVDYAYEPEEMKQLYETVSRWHYKRLIQVLGPTGGGRDKARIPILGQMAGEKADVVIITTDDPYDDNPEALAEFMAQGVRKTGKIMNDNFFIIIDRRTAIIKALKTAKPGDLVLITGKGADQKIALANGKYLDWDDREVVKRELAKLIHN